VPYPEWSKALREAPPRGDDPVAGVLRGAAPGVGEIWDGNVYDDSNTRRVLGRAGLRRPEIDGELLGRYVRFFARRGWVEAPPALSGDRRAQA